MKKRFSELKRSDVFTHVTNLTYLPKWGVLLIDLLLALIAYVISYMISYNLAGLQVRPGILPIWQQAGIVMVLQAIMFWVFHTYSGILALLHIRGCHQGGTFRISRRYYSGTHQQHYPLHDRAIPDAEFHIVHVHLRCYRTACVLARNHQT